MLKRLHIYYKERYVKSRDDLIEEIYYMIMDLYSDFPAFKKLNKELIHYSLFFCIKIYDKIYNR
jgi:hypothetical protein